MTTKFYGLGTLKNGFWAINLYGLPTSPRWTY